MTRDFTSQQVWFEWRPIDTAPRNEQILVFEPDAEPHVVAAMLVDNHMGRWWQYADHSVQDAAPDGPIATHWMPLPPPPADQR